MQEEQCTILLQVLGFKSSFNALELTRNLFTLIGPLKINTIPLFLTRVFIQGKRWWPSHNLGGHLQHKTQSWTRRISYLQYSLAFLSSMVWCFSVANALATGSLEQFCPPFTGSLPILTSLSRMKSLCRQTVRSPQIKELLFQEGTPKAILFFMEPHFFRRQVASSENKVCKPSICFK